MTEPLTAVSGRGLFITASLRGSGKLGCMRACMRACFLAVLLLAIFSDGALAQTYPVGKIAFSGTDLSQQELLAFTGLRTGPVTRDQMQAAATRLTDTGLFADARFTLDGENLTFELKASPAVVAVQYDE